MDRTYLGFLAILIVTVAGCGSHSADESSQQPLQSDDEVTQFEMAVRNAKSVKQLAWAIGKQVRNESPELLAQLKRHENAGIALHAAWREAARQQPPDSSTTTTENPFHQFVAFVEERLPVDVPDWWKEMARSGEKRARHPVPGFEGDDQKTVYYGFHLDRSRWYGGTENGIVLPKTAFTEKAGTDGEGGVAILQFDLPEILKCLKGAGIDLSKRDGNYFARDYHILSPVIEKDVMFAVLASLGSTPGLLVKIDRRSGDVAWQAPVWADGAGMVYQGKQYHFVEPRIGRDAQVYVFGCRGLSVYVEAFSANDGACQFRFSSDYWCDFLFYRSRKAREMSVHEDP